MITPTYTPPKDKRLESLDVLRGLDMFMLVFFQPVLLSVIRVADVPWLNGVAGWFDHAVWEGFTPWDLVMPLFLFMTGCAMPFAFSKAMRSGDKSRLYRKILKRFIILFLLGMVVQGNLLGLDTNHIYLYTNTLQAIATGYLIGSVILLNFSLGRQCVCAAVLLVVYAVPMLVCGDMTAQGNFAELVDRTVLGRFRDGVYWDEAGQWHFAQWYTYTWIWSSINFTASVLLGAIATQLIRRKRTPDVRTALLLSGIGVGMIAVAWAFSGIMPIIKRIWTSTMVLYAGGWCYLLLALSYYVVDVCGIRRGLGWLKIYGMNAITAYVLGEIISFRSVVNSLTYGLEHHVGEWYPVILTFGNFFIVFLILAALYRLRIFVKV